MKPTVTETTNPATAKPTNTNPVANGFTEDAIAKIPATTGPVERPRSKQKLNKPFPLPLSSLHVAMAIAPKEGAAGACACASS